MTTDTNKDSNMLLSMVLGKILIEAIALMAVKNMKQVPNRRCEPKGVSHEKMEKKNPSPSECLQSQQRKKGKGGSFMLLQCFRPYKVLSHALMQMCPTMTLRGIIFILHMRKLKLREVIFKRLENAAK